MATTRISRRLLRASTILVFPAFLSTQLLPAAMSAQMRQTHRQASGAHKKIASTIKAPIPAQAPAAAVTPTRELVGSSRDLTAPDPTLPALVRTTDPSPHPQSGTTFNTTVPLSISLKSLPAKQDPGAPVDIDASSSEHTRPEITVSADKTSAAKTTSSVRSRARVRDKKTSLIASTPDPKSLRGHVTLFTQEEPLAQQVGELIHTALDRDDEYNKIDGKLSKQTKTARKALTKTVDAAHFVLMFKGVSPSSEAGDVILNEKSKAKSVAASEYLKQRKGDETELAIICQYLQLAMGLGNPDQVEGQIQAAEAQRALTDLAGAEETAKLVELLKAKQSALAADVATAKVWSISQKRQMTKNMMEACLDTDPVIQQIKKRVWKYNHRSKIAMASQRIIRTSLSLAGMTPSLVAPAAQTALFAYIMISGGSEEDKLLKELYLDKRLDSRNGMLSETAHLALENYQMASLTGNALLKESCTVLFRQMMGADKTQSLLTNGINKAPEKEPQAATPEPKTPDKSEKADVPSADM